MLKNTLYIKDIVENQQFEVLNKSNNYEQIIVKSSNINRTGLELLGYKTYQECWEVVYWGKKENNYLQSITEEEAKEKISMVLEMKPPLLILGCNFQKYKLVQELAKKYDITVVKTERNLIDFQIDLLNFMLENSAPYEIIHGSLCSVFGIGTLVIGDSGVGKSETIIELIKRGHIFVADDVVKIVKHGDRVFGCPDKLNSDFIEIRGLGILSFSRTFGIEKMISSVKINVVIELIKINDKKVKFERLGSNEKFYELLGIKLVHYQIPVTEGRNVSDIIETAITKYKLKRNDFDATKLFIDKAKKR